jgi:hypothetical protein
MPNRADMGGLLGGGGECRPRARRAEGGVGSQELAGRGGAHSGSWLDAWPRSRRKDFARLF